MGLYKQIRELWKKPKVNMAEGFREKLIAWRKEPVTIRVERPTRLDRARSVGYKAKQGIIVVRQRVNISRRMREQPAGGRRPKANRRKKIVSKNFQQVAEERAQKKFTNLNVLNSYWVASDGKNHWYEIILVDIEHPFRIVFEPGHNPVPKTEDGGIDLTQVTAIEILSIEDYH